MSTTLQHFLEAGLPNSWSIFETCHTCDSTSYGSLMNDSPRLAKCMEDVLRCDFSHFGGHWQRESPERARDCANPQHEWRVFKTVTVHNLRTMIIPRLNADPSLHAILIERDPRGIYASMKAANFRHASTIRYLCGAMVKNLDVAHERLHRIRFEDVLADPPAALGGLLGRLGARLGPEGEAWIAQNFRAGCREGAARFPLDTLKSCQNNSELRAHAWDKDLSDAEKEEFLVDPSCQKLAADRYFGRASPHVELLRGTRTSNMSVPRSSNLSVPKLSNVSKLMESDMFVPLGGCPPLWD